MESQSDFLKSLPPEFSHSLSSFDGTNTEYTAVIHSNICDLNEARMWVTSFSRVTKTNWTVRDTHTELQKLQRIDYVCHMMDYHHRSLKMKNTAYRYKNCKCPAKLNIKIKQVNHRSKQRYSWIRDGMPATVTITHNHNHPICNAEALSLRKIDPIVRQKFEDYFHQGMTAATAAEYHLSQMELDPEIGNIVLARADAALNPKHSTVSYLYSQWREQNLGKWFGEGMWTVLEEKVALYASSGTTVKIHKDPFAVAILTPIMKRAHTMKSAADVAFIDSTASCDSENHTITFIMVMSPHGAVPGGVTITCGQSQENYMLAFSLLSDVISESKVRGFGGQGWPTVIITDDSAAEQAALKGTWPNSMLKLCHFHVLQAVWRWLWDSKHSITKDNRRELMVGFRQILYSTTELDAHEHFSSAMKHAENYSNFQSYMTSLWGRREDWCMAWRNIPSLRGKHTNNYAEITVRLFKDHVLSRCKAFNAVALVDFVVSVMERFYRNRLERFANGRVTMHHLLLEKLLTRSQYLTKDDIRVETCNSNTIYLVPSESHPEMLYEVDTSVGVCTCPSGMDGRCCKHQVSIYKLFDETMPNIPSVTAAARFEAARVALGDDVPSQAFYETLGSSSSVHEGASAALVETAGQIQTDLSTEADSNGHPAYSQSPMHDSRIRESWESINTQIQGLLDQVHFADDDMLAGLNKLKQRVANIHTGSQLMTFITAFGGQVPRRHSAHAMIRTQPTAASRRKRPGITRGAKRQSSGRPAKGEGAPVKRPRNLGLNISANVPNAKSHGKGH